MPEPLERREFDELLRLETEAPGHLDGFEERRTSRLHEVDIELGRAEESRPRHRVLVVVAATVAVGMLLLALSLGGSSSEPSAAELRQMHRLIQEWETASWQPWPPAYYAENSLPPRVHEQMRARKLDVARRVGTEVFVQSHEVQADMAAYLEEFHKGGEPMAVRVYQRVLDVTFDRLELGGDVVVRVPVWIGEVTAYWDEAQGKLTRYHRIDTTPVYEFTMRKVDSASSSRRSTR